jgi:hypothetical protein
MSKLRKNWPLGDASSRLIPFHATGIPRRVPQQRVQVPCGKFVKVLRNSITSSSPFLECLECQVLKNCERFTLLKLHHHKVAQVVEYLSQINYWAVKLGLMCCFAKARRILSFILKLPRNEAGREIFLVWSLGGCWNLKFRNEDWRGLAFWRSAGSVELKIFLFSCRSTEKSSFTSSPA